MLYQQPPTNPIIDNPIAIVIQKEEPKPEPKLYTIKSGDTLSRIAKAENVAPQGNRKAWERIWDANPKLDHPDQINVSDRLKIPRKQDKLKPRPFPASVNVSAKAGVSTEADKPSSNGGLSVSKGNLYDYGWCTWYAKHRRPDLPNRMGNAINWASSARRAGFSVGSTPRVGAIAQLGNHVSYVYQVNSNGTFNVREMNWVGLGIVSSRSNISPSGYQFIY